MASKEANLIDALYRIANDAGGRPLEKRMADFAVWYYQNRGRLPRDNLAARQDFTEKSIWILLEIIAIQQDRIHELENKGRSKHLFLPNGVTLSNERKYG